MKKILVILLCAVLAVSLFAACDTTPQPSSSAAPAPEAAAKTESTTPEASPSTDGGKVTIASFPDQPKAAFEAAIAAANLPFEVEIIEFPQNEYENKIKLAFSSGTSADMVLMDGPNVANYAKSGVLEPLDSYWDKSDFDDLVDASKSEVTWEGKIWAAPLNESNTVLFYNKPLFEELGIEVPTKVADAWTLEQLAEVCEKVVKKDASGKVERFAIQPQMFSHANKNEGMTYTEMLWVWMTGGEFISPDGSTATGYFDSDASKKGLQFYADLFAKGYATTEDIPNAFETGKVAMWVNGPWMIGTWKNQFPEFYEGGWGAMPLPKGTRGASGSGSWTIAISSKSENKENAWKTIYAITGKEGNKIWCDETGNIPTRKSVFDQSPTYKEYPYDIINQQLVETAIARPVTPAYPGISEALMDCFNELAFGEPLDASVEKAVNKMNTAINDAK